MADPIQVDFLLSGLHDSQGNPLNGGKVYTYAAGTTTPKTCWLDKDKVSVAANPIILSTLGQAQVYCDGWYQFVVTDANGVTINTLDNLFFTAGGDPGPQGFFIAGEDGRDGDDGFPIPGPGLDPTMYLRAGTDALVDTTGTITFDANVAGGFYVTLTGTGRTMAMSNLVEGQVYRGLFIQGSGGSKTITTWPTITWLSGGTVPVLSTTAGAADAITFWKVNGTLYASFVGA